MSDLQTIIESAFDARDTISPSTASAELKAAVNQAIDLLNSGEARVAEKIDGEWVVHQWLKKQSYYSSVVITMTLLKALKVNSTIRFR